MKTYESSKRGSQIDSVVEYIQETLPQALEDINNVIEELSEDVGSISGDVTVIQNKIPNQATSDNQLADKDFVNSSIATETAHYISDTDNQPFTSENDLPTANVTNNDYAFVTGTDSDGNTFYDRYKATVSGNVVTWAKEYRLNNSSFTAAQWAAITSGITVALVTKLSNIDLSQYYTKSQTDNLLNAKYEKPSAGIPKTDLSSEVQASLDLADTAIQDISGKQDTLASGTNIKTINGESVLGSGDLSTKPQWKLLATGTYTETDYPNGLYQISTPTVTGFFANADYTKFKIVLDITPIDTYTANSIAPRFWFTGNNGKAYHLYDIQLDNGAIYKETADTAFHAELLVERWVGGNDGVSTTLITKDTTTGNPKFFGSKNEGVFLNGNTKSAINQATFQINGAYSYIKSGTIKLYALEGDEEIVPSDNSGGESNVLEGVQVNGTDLTISNKKVNILTETAYNASTNKIATMSDIASAVGDIETALDSINDGLEALL